MCLVIKSLVPELTQLEVKSRGVTEFEFECCWNSTTFQYPNPSDVQWQFLVEFKFGFVLRNSKKIVLSARPAVKHDMVNNKHSHAHCYKVIMLTLENSLLNTEIFLLVLHFYCKLLFGNTVCK